MLRIAIMEIIHFTGNNLQRNRCVALGIHLADEMKQLFPCFLGCVLCSDRQVLPEFRVSLCIAQHQWKIDFLHNFVG